MEWEKTIHVEYDALMKTQSRVMEGILVDKKNLLVVSRFIRSGTRKIMHLTNTKQAWL